MAAPNCALKESLARRELIGLASPCNGCMGGTMSVLEIYIRPPLAIARVGPGSSPMPNFRWVTDRSIHGGHRTSVQPDVTLVVEPDGSLTAELPDRIQFSEVGKLRPVAPFFELWVRYVDDDGAAKERPLTASLLAQLGGSLEGVRYRVSLANRKAQRRALSAACSFEGAVTLAGDDHRPHEILAFSPHNPGEIPLVARDRPIPLGSVQVIRPRAGVQEFSEHRQTIDYDTLRIRFTPPRGEVYGSPESTEGPASPLPPGGALPPVTLGGPIHEIVPPANRILNLGTPWSSYIKATPCKQQDPQPGDSYDGANTGDNRSWGVVDDTSDGVIEAQVVIRGERFLAHARLFSSCPDYAPDRRAFYSFADELADRDLRPPAIDATTDAGLAAAGDEVADLFQRVFEVASTVNLAATRNHGILENTGSGVANPRGLPQIDWRTMTKEDVPFAKLSAELSPPTGGLDGGSTNPELYASLAALAHARLSDVESLLDFLASDPDRVRQMLRPPFGRFSELPERPLQTPNDTFRDPRVPRDTMQDMRMPPYMRDSDENSLSLTHRQYRLVLELAQRLAELRRVGSLTADASPAERRIAAHVRRLREARAAKAGEGIPNE